MKELASQIISLITNIAPAVIPLIAVYFGWKLSTQSERRKRKLEDLENRFNALRELRVVLDNIPRGLTVEDLEMRLMKEPELLNNLAHRLSRLLGLRRELIPHLDEKMVSFIDQRFAPLFNTETGRCELKSEALKAFAECCVEMVIETNSIEKKN